MKRPIYSRVDRISWVNNPCRRVLLLNLLLCTNSIVFFLFICSYFTLLVINWFTNQVKLLYVLLMFNHIIPKNAPRKHQNVLRFFLNTEKHSVCQSARVPSQQHFIWIVFQHNFNSTDDWLWYYWYGQN